MLPVKLPLASNYMFLSHYFEDFFSCLKMESNVFPLEEKYQDKRKASMEHMEQPPPKKIATDGPVDEMPVHMQVEPTAPAPSGDSKTGLSTSSENQPDYSEEGKRNRKHNSSVYYCV